jgi:hypothetical protein
MGYFQGKTIKVERKFCLENLNHQYIQRHIITLINLALWLMPHLSFGETISNFGGNENGAKLSTDLPLPLAR